MTDVIDETVFAVKFGALPAQWDSIAAGSNVTHVVIVTPLITGQYNFTSGQIVYKAAEDADPTV